MSGRVDAVAATERSAFDLFIGGGSFLVFDFVFYFRQPRLRFLASDAPRRRGILVSMKAVSPQNLAIDAKWTSSEECRGWRHFRITGRRHGETGLELELMAVCDREVRFWLKPEDLKVRENWMPGWKKLP